MSVLTLYLNVCLHGSVAWFTFDTVSYPSETRLTADGLTVTTDSYEARVLLSSVGFSRGVHYWEFTIERYDGTADPAFGIARRDISRETMLGILNYLLFINFIIHFTFLSFTIQPSLVVSVTAYHQCGPGSNPTAGIINLKKI